MKELDLKTSTPFFARLIQAEIACPRCDRVYKIGARGGVNPRVRVKSRLARVRIPREEWMWNPLTCRFRCEYCKLTLRLGVVAHPVKSHARSVSAPSDTVPSYAQALQIRQALSRVSPERASTNTEVNRIAAEEAEGCPEDDLGGAQRWRDVLPQRLRERQWWPGDGNTGSGQEGDE